MIHKTQNRNILLLVLPYHAVRRRKQQVAYLKHNGLVIRLPLGKLCYDVRRCRDEMATTEGNLDRRGVVCLRRAGDGTWKSDKNLRRVADDSFPESISLAEDTILQILWEHLEALWVDPIR